MTTTSHQRNALPPLRGTTDPCSNTYPELTSCYEQAVCGGSDTSPKMEKVRHGIFDDDDDYHASSTSTSSSLLPQQSASDIFYAMINGEALGTEDPSTTATVTEDDEETEAMANSQSAPLSPFHLEDDVDAEEELLMSSHQSSSIDGSVHRKNKNKRPPAKPRGKTNTTSNKNKVPPTVIACDIALDEMGCEHWNEDETEDLLHYDVPLKSSPSSPQETEKNKNNRRPPPKNNSTSIFYQLANEVRTRFELQEKAERFKSCVDVRDRTKNLVVFKHCFIGREAVDAMLYCELAKTREEAVELGRRLAHDMNLFKHVRGRRHLFQDDDSFYQYNNKNSGSNNNNKQKTKNTTMRSGDTFKSTQPSSSCSASSCCGDSSVASCSNSSLDPQQHQNEQRLQKMAKAFRECVHVRDRRFRLKTYKQCFVGSEAVDALVFTRLVPTRKDAVEFGRTLMREMNLFQHVTGDHAFCDDRLFFRFTEDGPANHRLLPMPLATL